MATATRAMLSAALAGAGWKMTADMVKAQSGTVLLIGLFLAPAGFR